MFAKIAFTTTPPAHPHTAFLSRCRCGRCSLLPAFHASCPVLPFGHVARAARLLPLAVMPVSLPAPLTCPRLASLASSTPSAMSPSRLLPPRLLPPLPPGHRHHRSPPSTMSLLLLAATRLNPRTSSTAPSPSPSRLLNFSLYASILSSQNPAKCFVKKAQVCSQNDST